MNAWAWGPTKEEKWPDWRIETKPRERSKGQRVALLGFNRQAINHLFLWRSSVSRLIVKKEKEETVAHS